MTNQNETTINCSLIIDFNLEISILSLQLINHAKYVEPKKKKQTNVPIGDQDMESEGGIKFGWIKGVLMRCILNIWGNYIKICFTFFIYAWQF